MSELSELMQERAGISAVALNEELIRPFMLLKPQMFPDGNQWCALYGINLQEGVCGFGGTTSAASYDFDKNWFEQDLSLHKRLEK